MTTAASRETGDRAGRWSPPSVLALAGLMLTVANLAFGAEAGTSIVGGVFLSGAPAGHGHGAVVRDQYYATGPALGGEQKIGEESLLRGFLAEERAFSQQSVFTHVKKRRRQR